MFAPGDGVHVAKLGKGVVREVRNGRRYVVELKGRSLIVAEDQLSPLEERRPSGPEHAAEPHLPADLARDHVPAFIDLHGMTTIEAVTALDGFLDDAIRASHSEVRVIHGRSGGRVKAAVQARLRTISSVRSFRVDPSNPGVTIVAL
jgi:dsDNA-specific endonuclease/ATPase MutS2